MKYEVNRDTTKKNIFNGVIFGISGGFNPR